MDYRNILATGFLLLCGAVFVHSLKSANAFPQGPNVSMGSNPIESWAGVTPGSSTWITIDTMQNDFIITDIFAHTHASDCNVALATQNTNSTTPLLYSGRVVINHNWAYQLENSFKSGIKIEAGETLYLYHSCQGGLRYNISGYYTH